MISRRPVLSIVLLGLGCEPHRARPPELPLTPIASKAADPADPPAAEARADGTTAQRQPGPTGCVHFWPELRLRSYAYDHIVHLSSDCHRVAPCTVATDLSPTAIAVAVDPGTSVEVVTLRGADSPEFTPRVRCSFATR